MSDPEVLADQPQQTPPWPYLASSGLLILLSAAFLISSLFTLRYALSALSFDYQLDREEGFLLQQALDLRALRTIYPTLDTYPYTVGNYPPVYPATYALALSTGMEGLPAGRVIVLIATLLIAALLAWLTWRWTREPAAAALAPGLFLTTYDVSNWAAYARVDLPAIALALAGLLAFGRGEKRWQWAVALLLFLLAFFTKQTAILAPGALFFVLLLERRWRHAAAFAALLAGTALAAVALLTLLTRGQFWKHTVTYNANAMDWGQFLNVWLPHLWRFDHWWYLAAVAVLVALVSRWRSATLEARTAATYLILATLSLVQTAKAGAAENYLLEFHAALALATSAGLGTILAMLRTRRSSFRWPLPAAAAALLLLAIHLTHLWSWQQVLMKHFPAQSANAAYAPVLLRILETPGDVLSEHPIFPILAGRAPLYQPFIMRQLALEGKWNQDSFLDDLGSRRFGLIIALQDLNGEEPLAGWTDDMRAVILDNYMLDETINPGMGHKFYLYRRKSR